MITELNDFLTYAVTFERRAVMLETARVLESVVGENIYIPIDEALTAPEAADTNFTVDSIGEALLGSMEVAYNKFGVYFDEELIEQVHLPALANTLEAMVQLPLNEARDYLNALIDGSNDAQEALFSVLEEVSPGSSAVLEEIIERVDYNLIYKLRDLLREPDVENLHMEAAVEAEAQSRNYIERCQTFRKKFGRTPLVGNLLDHGAKLHYSPEVTLSLISGDLSTEDAKATAAELYALVSYSDVSNAEVISTTKRLIEQVCVDPDHHLRVTDAFHAMLGG